MGFAMLGGLVNIQKLRSGFVGGGFSGLTLCCFYSKLRNQKRRGECAVDGGCV